MFFEGRRSYLRIAKFFQFYMYKSVLFNMVQLYNGFLCNWSGTTVFDGWYIYFFGIVFGVIPVTWIGIFDEDVRY